MNIALLIGVSDYENSPLSACANDVKYVENLLKATERFDYVCVIATRTDHFTIKEELSRFVDKYRNKKPDQLFYYYSGHGMNDGEDFTYMPSDFDDNKPKSTGVTNSDLDKMLRVIKPKVLIKIVDACYSEMPYIKDPGSLDKFMKGTETNFQDCYFMFSSRRSQPSVADDNISYFTKSLLKCVAKYKGKQVRYNDIINYLMDDKTLKNTQTPYFVNQGTLTDIFCTVTENVFKAIPSFINQKSATPDETQTSSEPGLVELIRKDARRFCTQEEVIGILEQVKHNVSTMDLSSELSEFYEIKYEFPDTVEGVPATVPIGSWLEGQTEEYFARPKYQTRYERKIIRQPMPYVYPTAESEHYEETPYSVLTGYKITADCPFQLINIQLLPKLENVPYYDCIILFIFSKTTIQIFYEFFTYKSLGWNERRLEREDIQWKQMGTDLKDSGKLTDLINLVFARFQTHVLGELKNKFKSESSGSEEVREEENNGPDKENQDS